MASPGHVVQATLAVDPGGCRALRRAPARPAGDRSARRSGSSSTAVRSTAASTSSVTRRSRRSADWKPLYGERAVIPDRYEAIDARPRDAPTRPAPPLESSCAPTTRASRSATSCRRRRRPAHRRSAPERSEFRFAGGSVAWPIYEAEETFPTEPVPLGAAEGRARTRRSRSARPAGFASVLDAFVADYPRMRLDPAARRRPSSRASSARRRRRPASPRPWRVVLLGENEARLVENEHLVPSLNPPCAIADTSWIRPGKTISNEGSAPLETRAARAGRRLRRRERVPLPAARLGLVRDRVDVDGRGARHLPQEDAGLGGVAPTGCRTRFADPSEGRARAGAVPARLGERHGRRPRPARRSSAHARGAGRRRLPVRRGRAHAARRGRPRPRSSPPTASGASPGSSPASSRSARRRTRGGSAGSSRPRPAIASGCASTTPTCPTAWSAPGRTSSSARAAAGRRATTPRRTT